MVENQFKRMVIENAAESAERLKLLLKEDGEITVDLGSMEKIDLSGLQLLISAQKSAEAGGKVLFFTGKPADSVLERIKHSGFILEYSGDNRKNYLIRRNSSEY